MLEKVARWVASCGRNVSQPGKLNLLYIWRRILHVLSNDCILRDLAYLVRTSSQLLDRSAALRRRPQIEEFWYASTTLTITKILTHIRFRIVDVSSSEWS